VNKRLPARNTSPDLDGGACVVRARIVYELFSFQIVCPERESASPGRLAHIVMSRVLDDKRYIVRLREIDCSNDIGYARHGDRVANVVA